MNAQQRSSYFKKFNARRKRGHHNLDTASAHLGPSAKLRSMIEAFPSVNAAAKQWGLTYVTLKRFIDGSHGISGNTVAQILSQTGLKYEHAFVHKE